MLICLSDWFALRERKRKKSSVLVVVTWHYFVCFRSLVRQGLVVVTFPSWFLEKEKDTSSWSLLTLRCISLPMPLLLLLLGWMYGLMSASCYITVHTACLGESGSGSGNDGGTRDWLVGVGVVVMSASYIVRLIFNSLDCFAAIILHHASVPTRSIASSLHR